MTTLILKTNKLKSLAIIAVLFLASCKVMLVGAYDQVTDQGIQKIQAEIATTLVKVERNLLSGATEDNKYEKFKGTYESMAGEIAVLKIRCSALPKYDIVLQQVGLLEDNLKNLEALHKIGFKNLSETAPIKSAFETQFKAMITLQNALKREKSK